jgi:hypothetical protein
MLAALIAGETDPGKLAALTDYRIKAPPVDFARRCAAAS